MNPEQRIKELLRPVGFRSKRINTEFPMFKDGVMEFDKWSTRITYKGKQLDNVYMAKKGDFKQPRLDMVLNSYFTNSYMYRNYDYFDIADLIWCFWCIGVYGTFERSSRRIREIIWR